MSRLKTPAKEEEAPASSSTPSRHLLAASSGASPLSAGNLFESRLIATKACHENDEDVLSGMDLVTNMGRMPSLA